VLEIFCIYFSYLDTNEAIYVYVSIDDARVGVSLHVHAADEDKSRCSGGIRMNY
jgi:hypothetical protein